MVTICFPYFRRIFVQRFGDRPGKAASDCPQSITRAEFEKLFAEDLKQRPKGTVSPLRQFHAKNKRG